MTLFLILFCIAIAVLFLWAARLPNTFLHSRDRLNGGALIMLLLAAFLGFVLFRQAGAEAELEAVIPVYPDAASTGWFPQVSEDRFWVLESPDGLDAIAGFYEQVAANSEWILRQSGDDRLLSVYLERDGMEVSLQVLREGEISTLTYIVLDPE